MSVQPFYSPRFRAFDSNGNPLAGGLLYTYAAGTTTPLATYTSSTGSTANSNPVVLDANGEAEVWTTAGVDYKFVLRNSAGVTQWTVDNVPSPAESVSTNNVAVDPGGRLSLTTGTPVTTSDVTSATTIYYVPYKSDKVPLYDGSAWAVHAISTELSQTTADATKSPAAVANNSNYDLFIWDDSGTLRLSRGPAWTSDTARGTGAATSELERLNGRWVNKVSITNGPSARRGLYVGTVRSDGSAQINDSLAKRHVWNAYSRTARPMRVTETADEWDYQPATIRQARASAANQLDFIVGQSEDEVEAWLMASAESLSGATAYVGIGLDSTTAFASGYVNSGIGGLPAGVGPRFFSAAWRGYPGLGRHYLSWLEAANSTNIVTFKGDAAAATHAQSGIHGRVWA